MLRAAFVFVGGEPIANLLQAPFYFMVSSTSLGGRYRKPLLEFWGIWTSCLRNSPYKLTQFTVPAYVIYQAGSSENGRMSLLKIEEPPLKPFWKQIIMKWVYYKGKMKIRFYPQNLDPTGKYNGKSTFLPKTWYRVLFSPVILPLAVWPKPERRVRIQSKDLSI